MPRRRLPAQSQELSSRDLIIRRRAVHPSFSGRHTSHGGLRRATDWTNNIALDGKSEDGISCHLPTPVSRLYIPYLHNTSKSHSILAAILRGPLESPELRTGAGGATGIRVEATQGVPSEFRLGYITGRNNAWDL